MKAWTYVYSPFRMGGDTWHPTGFEFESNERIELGKGFYGYVLKSPNGKTIVVEEKSGAIVGDSLERVKADIENGDIEIMKQQVKQACDVNVKIIDEEDFWKIYDKIN